MRFERRALGPKDVAIQLQYCGICHSDIHHGREHWRKALEELGIGFVPFSPLGKGFLTGKIDEKTTMVPSVDGDGSSGHG